MSARANGILMDAFYTDVRPQLAEWREARACSRPDEGLRRIGYQSKIEKETAGGAQAGWGA